MTQAEIGETRRRQVRLSFSSFPRSEGSSKWVPLPCRDVFLPVDEKRICRYFPGLVAYKRYLLAFRLNAHSSQHVPICPFSSHVHLTLYGMASPHSTRFWARVRHHHDNVTVARRILGHHLGSDEVE